MREIFQVLFLGKKILIELFDSFWNFNRSAPNIISFLSRQQVKPEFEKEI
jgi:hypothetical protein